MDNMESDVAMQKNTEEMEHAGPVRKDSQMTEAEILSELAFVLYLYTYS